MNTLLYIVIPCYNEEEVLHETASRLQTKMQDLQGVGLISPQSKLLFVNDGSRDSTWEIIQRLHEQNPLFAGVNLSKNQGHQSALLAGLMVAKEHAQAVISMDADLQDDINAVDRMLEQYHAGHDVVYGVRSSRVRDTWFKRSSAGLFYRLMHWLGVNIVANSADYRLMSKRALQGLEQFGEVNLFLRGVIPMVGYASAVVHYERGERFAGESKYPLRKMISFALEGITSLSVRPIRMITVFGLLFFLVSLGMSVYFVADYFAGNTVPGWASTVISVWAIGSLQLMAIGIIGEYIGKIYLESKARPRYIVESVVLREGDEDTCQK